MGLGLYNEDCITGARRHFPDGCMDLLICDPPFGIGGAAFGKHSGPARCGLTVHRLGLESSPAYRKCPGNAGDVRRE
jgi:hypothetical protein